MKSLILLTCSIFFTALAVAQNNNLLKGIVTYLNTGDAVPNVRIKAVLDGANEVYTDEDGIFTIVVKDGYPGMTLTLIVKKDDHQVVSSMDKNLVYTAIRDKAGSFE